jgi:hypothetical protein
LYDYKTNLPVGVFCVKDTKPREFSMKDMDDFLELAKCAEVEINRRVE